MRRAAAFRIAWAVMACGLLVGVEAGWAQDGRTARPLELLRQGEVEQGTTAPDAAKSIAGSADAGAHLAYATIVFYRAHTMFQFGKRKESEQLFRDIVLELTKAIELSAQDADAVSRNLVRSQSAYLLGDISSYVFSDPTAAKAFYEEALRYFPAHSAAEISLKTVQ